MEESSNLIRSTFDNASGLDIYQIKKTDTVINSGQRGKQWSVVSKLGKNNFSFITILHPYKGYDNRIDEDSSSPKIKGWEINSSKWKIEGNESTSLSKGNEILFFAIENAVIGEVYIEFSEASDVFIQLKEKQLIIKSLNEKNIQVSFKNEKRILLKSGAEITFDVE